MEQRIDFEKIQDVVQYLIDNPTSSYEVVVGLLEELGFEESSARYWLDMFIWAMSRFLVTEATLESCIDWICKQSSSGRSSEQITELLIGMFSFAVEDTNIVVVKDGEVYKEVVNKSKRFELLSRLQELQEEVDKIDDSNDTLLAWAKENCDFYIYKQSLLSKIEDLKAELAILGVEV